MQTFLPSPSFSESASVLDNKRLGKQRVETLQIMSTLVGGYKVIDHKVIGYRIEPADEELNHVEQEIPITEPLPIEDWYCVQTDTVGWQNHPAVLMWKGYEPALLEYQYAICYEWHIMRGFNDSCLRKTINLLYGPGSWALIEPSEPFWLGDEAFHLGHQSNLLRKNPEWYRPMFPKGLRDDLPYFWPTD